MGGNNLAQYDASLHQTFQVLHPHLACLRAPCAVKGKCILKFAQWKLLCSRFPTCEPEEGKKKGKTHTKDWHKPEFKNIQATFLVIMPTHSLSKPQSWTKYTHPVCLIWLVYTYSKIMRWSWSCLGFVLQVNYETILKLSWFCMTSESFQCAGYIFMVVLSWDDQVGLVDRTFIKSNY